MQWYRHHRPAWQKMAVSPHTSLPKYNFSSQNFTNLTTEILPLKFYHSVLSIFPHFKSRTGIVSYSLKPKVITMPISPCITYLPQWMTELATPFYHANWWPGLQVTANWYPMLPKPPQWRTGLLAAKVYTSITLANLFRDVDKMNLLVLFSLRKEP